MPVDTELYFSSVSQVLGSVSVRNKLSDYDHVTDSGILAQLLDDNGYSVDVEAFATIQAVFLERMERYIKDEGPFRSIDGAVQFVGNARESDDTRIAIATGCWRKTALLKLNSAGFNIDGIPLITSDDCPSRVGIMRIALSKIGDDFESITYFGDAEWDQHACHDLGWRFVAVGPTLGGIQSYIGIDP